jgi:DNA-binding transcriptional LysR family regulator
LAGHYNYPVVLRLFNESNGDFGQLDISDGWPTLSSPIESLDFLTTMLRNNDCMAILPHSSVARELDEGSLTALHIAGDTKFYVKLVLVYLREKASRPEIMHFIETLKSIEAARTGED